MLVAPCALALFEVTGGILAGLFLVETPIEMAILGIPEITITVDVASEKTPVQMEQLLNG